MDELSTKRSSIGQVCGNAQRRLGETLRRIVGEVFSDGAGLSLDAAKRPGDTKLSITEVSAEFACSVQSGSRGLRALRRIPS